MAVPLPMAMLPAGHTVVGVIQAHKSQQKLSRVPFGRVNLTRRNWAVNHWRIALARQWNEWLKNMDNLKSLNEQSEQDAWDSGCDTDLNTAIALLDEVLINGELGKDSLYAWYWEQQELIRTTKENLESLNE